MLKVNNVTKKYTSKQRNECKALQGISFNLPEKGLFFILGKSGSGKSTLLNLIGGLDRCTDGEIILNGLNISKMDAAQLDVYRNKFLGFIFQEFNLIENLSVAENIALPLSLQNMEVEGQVEKALEEVDLGDMGARFPDELSGGQKQRIAIARALVKNPQIILADEPTGNLDSETGKDIFGLLVNLSKSKLIIVVSHDAESAEKYGDGIIELKDGKIIHNSCPPAGEMQEAPADLKKYRSKLPNKVAFKMGVSNLFKKKIRSISCILIAILTILSIAVSQMILIYTPEYAIYRQVKKCGITHIVLEQDYDTYSTIDPSEFYKEAIPQSTIAHIEDDFGAKFIKQLRDGEFIRVESDGELIAAGYEFVGEHLPLDEKSMYFPEAMIEAELEEDSWYIYEDGEFIEFNQYKHGKETLIGKQMTFGISDLKYAFVIAGIIKTVEDEISAGNPDLAAAQIEWNNIVNGDNTFELPSRVPRTTFTYNDDRRLMGFEFTFSSSAEQFETDEYDEVEAYGYSTDFLADGFFNYEGYFLTVSVKYLPKTELFTKTNNLRRLAITR